MQVAVPLQSCGCRRGVYCIVCRLFHPGTRYRGYFHRARTTGSARQFRDCVPHLRSLLPAGWLQHRGQRLLYLCRAGRRGSRHLCRPRPCPDGRLPDRHDGNLWRSRNLVVSSGIGNRMPCRYRAAVADLLPEGRLLESKRTIRGVQNAKKCCPITGSTQTVDN